METSRVSNQHIWKLEKTYGKFREGSYMEGNQLSWALW